MRFMLLAALMIQLADPPSWTPTSWVKAFIHTIDRLEQTLVLPVGADPMDSYARTWWMEGHLLHGLFVRPDLVPGLEAGRVLSPGPPPHQVLDGGCGVVRVVYNPTPGQLKLLACNGES